ncbi:uncharacterized protein LOC135150202 [Daucus carota subsp. sativus]|uniref:uncharacterized protein LOC135150202 n=1 Tax=Daucus carota subsp. sativus TaxID=79200 RepID=UPI0030828AC2
MATSAFTYAGHYDNGGEAGSPSIVFEYDGAEYAVTPATFRAALNLPEHAAYITNGDANLRTMMIDLGYYDSLDKLDLISKDEKRPVLRPLQIPAPLRAKLNLPQAPQPQPPVSPTATRSSLKTPSTKSTPKPSKSTKSDAPSTKKTRTSVATQKRRRLVAAYDYEDLEVPPATNSEPSQASPKSKTARFKRRANKPKRAKVPITEITDFTVEEEQAPSTSLTDISQALMVHPLEAVPISAATASSTSSEVDEEIICKEQSTAEAETTFPEGAIIHDTAPENYKSDAVIEDSNKVALEALQSLAKASEEPSKSKSKSAAQETVIPDPVENVEDPASDDDKDDESSDDENNDEDEASGGQFVPPLPLNPSQGTLVVYTGSAGRVDTMSEERQTPSDTHAREASETAMSVREVSAHTNPALFEEQMAKLKAELAWMIVENERLKGAQSTGGDPREES